MNVAQAQGWDRAAEEPLLDRVPWLPPCLTLFLMKEKRAR